LTLVNYKECSCRWCGSVLKGDKVRYRLHSTKNKRLKDSTKIQWRTALSCVLNGACIQVAPAGEYILIGDSKNVSGPVVSYTRAEWNAFVDGIRLGDFDDLLLVLLIHLALAEIENPPTAFLEPFWSLCWRWL
jgi:hypothetical protein